MLVSCLRNSEFWWWFICLDIPGGRQVNWMWGETLAILWLELHNLLRWFRLFLYSPIFFFILKTTEGQQVASVTNEIVSQFWGFPHIFSNHHLFGFLPLPLSLPRYVNSPFISLRNSRKQDNPSQGDGSLCLHLLETTDSDQNLKPNKLVKWPSELKKPARPMDLRRAMIGGQRQAFMDPSWVWKITSLMIGSSPPMWIKPPTRVRPIMSALWSRGETKEQPTWYGNLKVKTDTDGRTDGPSAHIARSNC